MAENVYQELVTRIKADLSQLESGLKKGDRITQNSASKWERSFKGVGNAVRGMGIDVTHFSSILAPVIGAVGLKNLLNYSDAWKLLSNRLNLVSASSEELAVTQDRLFKIAQDTRSDLGATVTLYQRLTFATKGLGVSQDEIIKFTEQLNKQLLVGGVAAQEARAAVFQLTQAFNKGKLDGDEFRTVLETAPPILEALQDSLGKTRGEIIKMSGEGLIGPRELIDAVNDMSAVTDQRFSGLAITIDQAFTLMENSFTRFIGKSSEFGGVVSTITTGLIAVAENMEFVGRAALALGAVLGTRLAIGFVAAMAALNPFALALTAVVGTLAFFATRAEDAQRTSDEFTESMRRQETVLGRIDKMVTDLTKGYALMGIKIGEVLGLIDEQVAAEAHLQAISNGRASFTKGKTVDTVTFLPPKKQDPITPKPVEVDKSVIRARQALKDYVRDLERQQEILKQTPKEQAAMVAQYRALELAKRAQINLSDEEIEAIKQTARANYEMAESMKEAERFAGELKNQFAETARSIWRDSKNAGDALKRLGESLADMLIQRQLLGPLSDSLFGSPGSGGGGLFGDFLGSFGSSLFSSGGGFGGFFAEGGRPPVGKTSIVGENGPELFVPNSAGTIIPTSKMSGSQGTMVTVVQNINVSNDVPALIDAHIRQAAPMIAAHAREGVFESIRRGGSAARTVGRRNG